jgi:hypothetical protein
MRFMVIVHANAESESGVPPTEQELVEMGKFNEGLIKKGIMLAGEGLLESRKGSRIKFTKGSKPTVVDGPFAESKELVAGFWIVQGRSRDEIVELFKSAPFVDGVLEVRQVAESEDFQDSIKTEAGREVLRKEDEFRAAQGQRK